MYILKKDESKGSSLLFFKVVLITLFSIIVFGLSFVYYFVAVKSSAIKDIEPTNIIIIEKIVEKKEEKKEVPAEPVVPSFVTTVLRYIFPTSLPKDVKIGTCLESSLAQPFRNDAFKCVVESKIYDPCFSSPERDKVVCQMNPLLPDIFLINMSKPLPQTPQKTLAENWAWFLELEDDTFCAPYTGTRPSFDNQIAFYGCKSKIKGQAIVLIGALKKDTTWIAKKAIIINGSDGKQTVKSTEIVRVSKVWQ